MARNRFGGSAADWTVDLVGRYWAKPTTPATFTFWSGDADDATRTQYDDLLALAAPTVAVSTVTADANGSLPEFDGPDDDTVTRMWASADGGVTGTWITTSTPPAATNEKTATFVTEAGPTQDALSAARVAREKAPKLHYLDSYTNFVIDPAWWSDDRHLTATGYAAFADFIANAQDADGNYIITGTAPKVTVLGNSWIAQGGTVWGTAIQSRIPGATVVNAGVEGDESDLLLARFDTDVPTDSDYVVINEPGVNDTANGYSPATQAANLAALWAKARTIGATLIYTGHIPLSFAATAAAAYHDAITAVIGDASAFPAVTPGGMLEGYAGATMVSAPNSTSVRVGPGALDKVPAGAGNTGIGYNAGFALTTGTHNFALGYAALSEVSTGHFNFAAGSLALRYAVGNYNVAVGHSTLHLVTSGTGNIAIGYLAGYNVAGSTADATTDKHSQVIIGRQAGGNASNIVALGYYAAAKGEGAVAIGANTVAGFSGSVAIGRDNTGAGATAGASNEFVLGTALHRYKMPGLPTVAPTAGSGILWNDAGTVKVA